MNLVLVCGAVVVLAILGVVTYFWTSARSSETRAREERDLRDKAQAITAGVEKELAEARRQLAIERSAVMRIREHADSLRAERDRLQAELVKLAPGDKRLKSTLTEGV